MNHDLDPKANAVPRNADREIRQSGPFFYRIVDRWSRDTLAIFGEFVGIREESYADFPTGAVIIGYSEDNACVVIPRMIVGVPVVGIGEYAFNGKHLMQATLPEGLWRIGDSAFAETELDTVNLPESLRYIDCHAFWGCPLKHIDFPENLLKIGQGAFNECPLEEAVLPAGLTVIGSEAFADCQQLKYLRLPANIVSFVDHEATNGDPALEDGDFGNLDADELGTYDVRSFGYCENLTEVVFDYPVDIERAEGKRPLSRSALAQMFCGTPWLANALKVYMLGKRCVYVDCLPCTVEEIFLLQETADTLLLTGLKRKIDLRYHTVSMPKQFAEKTVVADAAVFVLTEGQSGGWCVHNKES